MRWEELRVPQFEALDRERTVIVLPIGSVEQHGRHLPVGVDTMLAHSVALAAAKRLGGRVVVLPPPWYGFSAHHMRFAGTVTLSANTMMRLVEDIAGSVIAHGFRRLLILNGHGGNAGVLDVLASELGHRFYGNARIAGLTYFQLARAAIAELRASRPGGMGHACEFETAMMQHLRPELVEIEAAAVTYPDPGSRYLSTDLLGSSAVRTYHDFSDLSETGTLGDPSLATPEKGARFHAAVVAELARFFEDFSQWPIPPTSARRPPRPEEGEDVGEADR
jgi:creatinine amidohydrolase